VLVALHRDLLEIELNVPQFHQRTASLTTIITATAVTTEVVPSLLLQQLHPHLPFFLYPILAHQHIKVMPHFHLLYTHVHHLQHHLLAKEKVRKIYMSNLYNKVMRDHNDI
jgi:hypothetical protein